MSPRDALGFRRFQEAYVELAAGPDQDIVDHTMIALGTLLADGLPGAHAAVVILFQRAYPDRELPSLLQAILGEQED